MDQINQEEIIQIDQTRSPMVKVQQGRSTKKPYFLIADPEPARVFVGNKVLCVNPKTGEETIGLVMVRWSFNWDVNPLSGLILLEYGCAPSVLRQALELKDDAFKDPNVSLLLIKEIK